MPAGDARELLTRAVKALADLSFECDGVTRTVPPSRETYNRTFAELQAIRATLSKQVPAGDAVALAEPFAWTGDQDIDLAMILLGRIDAPEDQGRLDQFEQIIKRLWARISREGQADSTGGTTT